MTATPDRLFLDFQAQSLRIPAQSRRQQFQFGEKAPPLVKFPAMLAQKVIRNTHSGSSRAAGDLGQRAANFTRQR